MCATGSYVSGVDRAMLWANMEQLQADTNTAKFVYWSLRTKKMVPGVANVNNPNMLDISGWSPDILRIVQAFGKNCF